MDFILKDRVKQTTYKIGNSSSIELFGAVSSYKTFSDSYEDDIPFSYCMTDGIKFEIANGTYNNADDSIIRSGDIYSSDGNTAINWSVGKKEIYVVVRADNHIITSKSGTNDVPGIGDVPYFDDPNRIKTDGQFTYSNQTLSSPNMSVSNSGDINFLFSNAIEIGGGTQTTAHVDNELNESTEIDQVINLSGDSFHVIGLNNQGAGKVFAGPIADCGVPPCPSGYPVFRALTSHDIPEISSSKVAYTPSNSGNWQTLPTNLSQALNSLSEPKRTSIRIEEDINGDLDEGFYEIRSLGNDIFIDVNIDGTVKTLNLGTIT